LDHWKRLTVGRGRKEDTRPSEAKIYDLGTVEKKREKQRLPGTFL